MENVNDRIRENDKVIAIDDSGIYPPEISKIEGTVQSVYYMGNDGVAIVNYPGGIGLVKVLTNDLIRVEIETETLPSSVKLTKERYKELTSKVMERESFDVSDTHYDLLKVSAELLFNRLEALLFGEADNV